MTECGHTASGNGFTFVCDRALNHQGWHQQTTQLYDSTSRTNWGDDGLATWASKDEARRNPKTERHGVPINSL